MLDIELVLPKAENIGRNGKDSKVKDSQEE